MSSSWDVEKSLAARIATEGRAPKAKHAMVLKKCIMGLAEHGLCSQVSAEPRSSGHARSQSNRPTS